MRRGQTGESGCCQCRSSTTLAICAVTRSAIGGVQRYRIDGRSRRGRRSWGSCTLFVANKAEGVGYARMGGGEWPGAARLVTGDAAERTGQLMRYLGPLGHRCGGSGGDRAWSMANRAEGVRQASMIRRKRCYAGRPVARGAAESTEYRMSNCARGRQRGRRDGQGGLAQRMTCLTRNVGCPWVIGSDGLDT